VRDTVHRDAWSAWSYLCAYGGIELDGRDEGLDERVRLHGIRDSGGSMSALDRRVSIFAGCAPPWRASHGWNKCPELASSSVGRHLDRLSASGRRGARDIHVHSGIDVLKDPIGTILNEVPVLVSATVCHPLDQGRAGINGSTRYANHHCAIHVGEHLGAAAHLA
jgi:hypothetical protein